MSSNTSITPTSFLPLTCTRNGACCHGKMVWINPWELARLATARGLPPRVFRDQCCEFGGIRLRFDGQPGWKGLAACSQYVSERGCIVHASRPLVCRLYPLGRTLRGKEILFMHEGKNFPCLEGCPEVVDLPYCTVSEYLAGQDATSGIAAQNEYLELMQLLADGAFALLLESGLAASGDRLTLRLWRELGIADPDQLAKRIGQNWIDFLMLPDINDELDNPAEYCRLHHDILQSQAQESFGALRDAGALRNASGLMMGLALHLGRGLGANPSELASHWIEAAKKLGASE